MIKELIEDINLAIRQGLKLESVLYTSYSQFFLELCEDIEVAIGGLKSKYPIFVIEASDYNLLLGQLLLNSVKLS